eukprot:2330545-Prymnesium_polylepis.1
MLPSSKPVNSARVIAALAIAPTSSSASAFSSSALLPPQKSRARTMRSSRKAMRPSSSALINATMSGDARATRRSCEPSCSRKLCDGSCFGSQRQPSAVMWRVRAASSRAVAPSARCKSTNGIPPPAISPFDRIDCSVEKSPSSTARCNGVSPATPDSMLVAGVRRFAGPWSSAVVSAARFPLGCTSVHGDASAVVDAATGVGAELSLDCFIDDIRACARGTTRDRSKLWRPRSYCTHISRTRDQNLACVVTWHFGMHGAVFPLTLTDPACRPVSRKVDDDSLAYCR